MLGCNLNDHMHGAAWAAGQQSSRMEGNLPQQWTQREGQGRENGRNRIRVPDYSLQLCLASFIDKDAAGTGVVVLINSHHGL